MKREVQLQSSERVDIPGQFVQHSEVYVHEVRVSSSHSRIEQILRARNFDINQ